MFDTPPATHGGAYVLNPTFPSLSNINLYACRTRLYLIGSHQVMSQTKLII